MKNKIISEEFPKKITTPFLYRITQTVILSLFIFCVFLIILYIVGNYQNFQDLSQKSILSVLFYTSILNGFLTLPVIVENIIMLITFKNKTGRIISLVFMIFTDVFSVFCIILSGAVEVLSSGL